VGGEKFPAKAIRRVALAVAPFTRRTVRFVDGSREAGLPSARRMRRDHPHGMLLAPNQPGGFLGTDRVLTEDRKVHLAPAELVAATRGL